jgi:hypothetical protein
MQREKITKRNRKFLKIYELNRKPRKLGHAKLREYVEVNSDKYLRKRAHSGG